MAGLIVISKDKGWSVASWVFRHVLSVSRKHLSREGSSRIVELIDRAEETGLEYLSLEVLSPSERKIFRQALEDAYQEMLISGKDSFGEPSFFPGFMDRFKELLDMMPDDQK